MRLSLARFFAVWLLAQIILPFTAPFPVCEIADFLGGTSPLHNAPVAPASSGAGQTDAYAYAPPLATTVGRLKLVVVTDLDRSTVICPISPITVVWRVAARGASVLPRVQPVVLRV
jgi:hypothetical protein